MRVDTNKLNSDAFGRWPGILASCGIASEHLKNEHGPCPLCGGKDRFRFDDQGRGAWICSKCGSGDGWDLLMRKNGWLFQHAKDQVASIVGSVPVAQVAPKRTDEDRIADAKKIWTASRRMVEGDPAWLYLHRRTGRTAFPKMLRFHHNLRHPSGEYFPAVVALMKDEKGNSCGVHRIFITMEGEKAPVENQKAALGLMGSVQLFPKGNVLGIAEGIETALAAAAMFKLPVWSAICANGVREWVPPAGVEVVHVFGDNDESYTGQAVSYECARRLKLSGLGVEVHIPTEKGADWADGQQLHVKQSM